MHKLESAYLRLAIGFPIVLIGGFLATWETSKATSFQFFGELVSRVETDEMQVALTFDDGPWNPRYAEEVIETLDRLDVKATFFLNGRGIENNFEAARNLVEAGHDIGNHAYSHDRLVFKGLDTVEREVESTATLIRDIGYEGELYFRPPYGSKLFTLPYYLSRNNITTVTWDVEPESYEEVNTSPDSIAKYVIENARPGSIILLHVLGSKNGISREAIPLVVEGLRQKGFQLVRLSELLDD